ncbi:MAG: hypothetical protein Q7S58_15680 [Candidatus Binatus sp.]|uniref:hypothetical protein n=1 Tax=Candidatus Binatus sp. TaxID=2811406 RepID=UPI00271668B6|nr:hypothetical protein [Candidatus Binatus sp.]MDO8433841.1 hypothetical protein [Candidatus Binatus sp.]
MAVRILHKQIEVVDVLAELGLRAEILRDAIVAGETARDGCTENDAINAPGFYAYAGTIRSLRDQLVGGEGWSRRDEQGLPMVVSPDGKIGIVVGSGDEATGNHEVSPRSKHSKGPATVAVINRNVQLQLWSSDNVTDPVDVEIDPNIRTYVLLRFRDRDTVYCELSVPSGSDLEKRINKWSERIILAPISLVPGPEFQGDGRDRGEKIEVVVSRRRA